LEKPQGQVDLGQLHPIWQPRKSSEKERVMGTICFSAEKPTERKRVRHREPFRKHLHCLREWEEVVQRERQRNPLGGGGQSVEPGHAEV